MRVFEKCSGEFCSCSDHVTVPDFVPCCPVHSVPLVAGEGPGTGRCVAIERHPTRFSDVTRRVVGFDVKRCRDDWPADAWAWKRRDLFADSDLPPWDGWEAPTLPELPIVRGSW